MYKATDTDVQNDSTLHLIRKGTGSVPLSEQLPYHSFPRSMYPLVGLFLAKSKLLSSKS